MSVFLSMFGRDPFRGLKSPKRSAVVSRPGTPVPTVAQMCPFPQLSPSRTRRGHIFHPVAEEEESGLLPSVVRYPRVRARVCPVVQPPRSVCVLLKWEETAPRQVGNPKEVGEESTMAEQMEPDMANRIAELEGQIAVLGTAQRAEREALQQQLAELWAQEVSTETVESGGDDGNPGASGGSSGEVGSPMNVEPDSGAKDETGAPMVRSRKARVPRPPLGGASVTYFVWATAGIETSRW